MTFPSSTPGTLRRRRLALSGRSLALLAACLLAAALPLPTARAQQVLEQQREYNVKAVTLYAFGRYVTWPEAAFADGKSPFVIGVLGDKPIHDALKAIAAKKTINNRPIVVRKLATPQECGDCHIAFITNDAPAESEAQLFAAAVGKPILLVGESPGFIERGGVVNFVPSGATVRFELSPEHGDAVQLSLDAKLLSLSVKSTLR
jgi:hypothetical protein